jgi:hypothetical protein
MKANEDRLQADAYRWFHNTYPHLRGLLNYNHNNSRNKIEGAKNKAMGLQKGRSDMVLYLKGKAFMIEWKTEKGKQHGKQKEWQQLIEANGFSYYIVRSVEEFKELVTVLISSYD